MIIEQIDAQLPGTVTDRHAFRGDQTIVIAKENLLAVVELIHREGFQLLVDITAVDWPERPEAQGLGRFDVVYHWLNLASQEQARGIEEIARAVAEMQEVTQRTAASAEQSASASEEMSARSNEIKGAVADLVAVVGGGQNR